LTRNLSRSSCGSEIAKPNEIGRAPGRLPVIWWSRIKELQPTVSNRQIARTLGVHHDTVDRDLGENPPRGEKNGPFFVWRKNQEFRDSVAESREPIMVTEITSEDRAAVRPKAKQPWLAEGISRSRYRRRAAAQAAMTRQAMLRQPKKFVFFFDGTGASAASRLQRETNVFLMNRALTYQSKTTFYFSGLGTRRDFISLASGAGLDEIIREAYVNLTSNYQPGDELYLFGWSRGAIAAWAFAGLISKSGLIGCDGLVHYKSVWDYFLLDTSLPANAKKAAEHREKIDSVWRQRL
jgi:hypothetical protein